jgi:N-methylhydantoinase A
VRRLSVDIGGTFTDAVYVDDERDELLFDKAPSTPEDYAAGLVDSLGRLLDKIPEVEFFVHGTTVCLNAILQGKLAKTAFITTAGFRDILELQRSNRPEIYDPFYAKPQPLIPRYLRFEVRERMRYDGIVIEPLDLDGLRIIAAQLETHEVEAVGICFLHSYANDAHERAAADLIRSLLPGIDVTHSTEVAREWREYERSSTAAFNAGLLPIMRTYLDSLESRMRKLGFGHDMHLMQSNGGITTSKIAKERPVHTLNSGVVGGVIGTKSLAAELGIRNAIGTDMGGTSFDVSIIVDGDYRAQPMLSISTPASGDHTYPILMPTLDTHAIGAGGGSIAWIDDGGGLHVGPISAGAEPGPAGYGRGGREATVTDANIVLGRLRPATFLGGRFTIYPELSAEAVGRVANQLGADLQRTAEGVLTIAVTNMANAIRTMTVDRGIDPRDFTLFSAGGAGGLHASLIARELGIPTVAVPPSPGNFAAWGLLCADVKHDYYQTFVAPLDDVALPRLEREFGELENMACATLQREGLAEQSMTFVRAMDLRYLGQGHALTVPVPSGQLRGPDRALIASRHDDLHLQTYLHNAPQERKEIVALKLTGLGAISSPRWRRLRTGDGDAVRARVAERPIYIGGQWIETAVFTRELLLAGDEIDGPAVVEEETSTTLVLPTQNLRVDDRGALFLTWKGA